MLQLMELLTGNTSLTVEELADWLDTTYRSIYRYIDSFREAGFTVQKVRPQVYQLLSPARGRTDILPRGANLIKVRALSDAAEKHRCVILHSYKSSHSGQKRDRHIEPFAFTANYIHVWAFDLDDGRNKTFGVSRIAEVEVLDEEWSHESEHRQDEIDIFRMPGRKEIHLKLLMSLLARNLLLEEYPLASSEIRPASKEEAGLATFGESWILETDICSLKGAGRFVIGLADHIKVLDSPELEKYIGNFASQFLVRG